jgi:hypothetical protein
MSTAIQTLSTPVPAAAPVITMKQVKAACKAAKEATAAGRVKDTADKNKKAAYMLVFEALLGVKSEDEVRDLSPEEFNRLARRRIRSGLVQFEPGMISADELLDKVIQKSKSERRPSWKDCFVKVLGESAATKVQEATPETFSYKFVEAGL